MFKDGTRATYDYVGQGGSTGPGGASVSLYGGIALNVHSPDDYKGISNSLGLTFSVLDKGVTASYFWNGNYDPLTPGIVQGIQFGYAPGAQLSAWGSGVNYRKTWSTR